MFEQPRWRCTVRILFHFLLRIIVRGCCLLFVACALAVVFRRIWISYGDPSVSLLAAVSAHLGRYQLSLLIYQHCPSFVSYAINYENNLYNDAQAS